ncbi:VanZ family protein [Reichenbachiella sp.]|uniref:VanZ family protein n=1 Tax=Reichenbachiella sp. TaxID=2184521 RepID=UPI003BB0904C
MNFFTSEREKRLWLLTLVVVATIYSTLGLASALVGLIPDRRTVDDLFMFGVLTIVIAVVTAGLQKNSGKIELAVGLGIIAVYLLAFLRMTIPQERTHLIEYGVVALLIQEALNERIKHKRLMLKPAWMAIILVSILGLVDECIQGYLPNRVFDMRDIFFNFLAGSMAVCGLTALHWAKEKSKGIKNGAKKS